MDTLLKVVGGFWAILGAANIIGMFSANKLSQTFLSFGLMFNVLLFVIPGLILYGIGATISKKRRTLVVSSSNDIKKTQSDAKSIEARLQQLSDLKEHGVILPEEYEARRAEILKEV